jgi:tetratricopeptide (TPR) repeat protein
MNSFQVIDLNNSAVAAMQQGRPKESIEFLRIALANLKDHFYVHRPQPFPLSSPSSRGTPLPHRRRELPRRVSDSSIETQSESELSSSSSSLSFNDEEDESLSAMEIDVGQDQPSVFSVPVNAKNSSRFSRKEDDALIFMYNRALVIFPDEQDKELITGAALFNMALVNHCRAMERGTSSLLTVALKIYETAAAVLEDKEELRDSGGLLQLAIYNNMAHIHSMQFSTEEMRECLDKTRTLLSDADDDESLVDEDDFNFFYLNTMLQIEELTLAPAA